MFRPSNDLNSGGDGEEGPDVSSKIKSHVAAFVVLIFLFRAAKVVADRSGFGLN